MQLIMQLCILRYNFILFYPFSLCPHEESTKLPYFSTYGPGCHSYLSCTLADRWRHIGSITVASVIQVVIWEGITALVQQHVMDHAFMIGLNDRLNLSL